MFERVKRFGFPALLGVLACLAGPAASQQKPAPLPIPPKQPPIKPAPIKMAPRRCRNLRRLYVMVRSSACKSRGSEMAGQSQSIAEVFPH